MLIGLRAKDKLGFIHGTCKKPVDTSPDSEKWLKVDSMVISWILSSMSKEIVEAFLYASSAKDLWDELAQRFGESNGPLIYQINREICSLSQGNMSLINYFTKLKKLWDELACLEQFPVCECEASKEIAEMENNTKLIQFLMGLNPSYDHVRNQILLMDPFPPVNKAYSMALQVEKQREINTFSLDSTESSLAMLAKGLSSKRIHEGNKNQNKRKDGIKKEDKYCEHCKTTSYFSESYFKIIEYPEWYKGRRTTPSANLANTTS
ncbi:uncharacterized protein LOC131183807 [Hevea brasiliensis]|uniref:uncharacterized protein LOC131183807 n=1 Tax=Hevea brasiliensis TaxID=3981 RepID=UPI0025E5B456|nr:uncharacterized protein LOC131183807 [Hevea brasiliensis]